MITRCVDGRRTDNPKHLTEEADYRINYPTSGQCDVLHDVTALRQSEKSGKSEDWKPAHLVCGWGVGCNSTPIHIDGLNTIVKNVRADFRGKIK